MSLEDRDCLHELEEDMKSGKTVIEPDYFSLGDEHCPGDTLAKAAADLFSHPNCKVERLRFMELRVSDDGAELLGNALPRSSTLLELNLYDNHIGVEGVRSIAEGASQSRSIQEISFWANPVGGRGTQPFAEYYPPFLKILNFRYTGLQDHAMPYVAVFLRNTLTLECLDLSYNEIENTGPIADALSLNSTLTTLNLRDNCRMGNSGIRGLAKAICHNTHLVHTDLAGLALNDDGGNMLLTALSHNHTLNITDVGDGDIRTAISTEIQAKIVQTDIKERRRGKTQRVSELLLKFSKYSLTTKLPSGPASRKKRRSAPFLDDSKLSPTTRQRSQLA